MTYHSQWYNSIATLPEEISLIIKIFSIDVEEGSTALACQHLQSCRIIYIFETEPVSVLSRECYMAVTLPGYHDFYTDFRRIPNCFDRSTV